MASGETDEERNKFYKWTLIGTTILLKSGNLFSKKLNLRRLLLFICKIFRGLKSMRLADFVVDFLAKKRIKNIFTVSGGGSIFLCDAYI